MSSSQKPKVVVENLVELFPDWDHGESKPLSLRSYGEVVLAFLPQYRLSEQRAKLPTSIDITADGQETRISTEGMTFYSWKVRCKNGIGVAYRYAICDMNVNATGLLPDELVNAGGPEPETYDRQDRYERLRGVYHFGVIIHPGGVELDESLETLLRETIEGMAAHRIKLLQQDGLPIPRNAFAFPTAEMLEELGPLE